MRVCIVPEYPMSLMTGGLQVQAVETCIALSSLGGEMSAELFDWSKTETLCDLYHFIGLPPHMFKIAELVRQANRPYVITLLCGSRKGLRLHIMAARQFIKSQILRRRARYESVMRAGAIIAITEADAAATQLIYGLERKQIDVVANGVGHAFFKCAPETWRRTHKKNDFVLCVGAVQQRKNQLLLAQVCNQLKLPLVLLGPVLPGQSEYAQRVGEAMLENESHGGQWLQHLRNEDELLQSAYAACRVFALLSSEETQPLSVLQAMAARKPVLLLDAEYAEDILFRQLPRVASNSLPVVADALQVAWKDGKPTELSADFTWPEVARQLRTIYERVLNSE